MDKDFCVIIPDRGDRPELLKHCQYQMERQTVKPQMVITVNYPPRSSPDLIERVKCGINEAKKAGFDYTYIVENDDYYPDDYFENMPFKDGDFVGIPKTIYYNIKYKLYREITHPDRSSLFCTGFKISALKNFVWPANDQVLLDKALWHFAWMRDTRPNKWNYYNPVNMPIGIKHGMGLCGGVYHTTRLNKYTSEDNNWSWLKAHTRKESFEFYLQLWHTLNK